jgi:hypothetical protein
MVSHKKDVFFILNLLLGWGSGIGGWGSGKGVPLAHLCQKLLFRAIDHLLLSVVTVAPGLAADVLRHLGDGDYPNCLAAANKIIEQFDI